MCLCRSKLSKVAPHLSADEIHPGVLFMAQAERGGSSYRGITLSIEGHKVYATFFFNNISHSGRSSCCSYCSSNCCCCLEVVAAVDVLTCLL